MVSEWVFSCCLVVSLGAVDRSGWRGTHIGNNADVLTEAGWETSGGVLGIGEVLEASGVKAQLQMFEIQGQLENGLIGGAVDGRQRVLTLLERVREGQGEQPKGQS